MIFREISIENRKEWTDAICGMEHAFAHSWDYCHANSHSIIGDTFLLAYSSKSSRFVLPLCRREYKGFNDFVTPYGFAGIVGFGDPFEFLRQLFTYLDGLSAYIGLHPIIGPPTLVDCEYFSISNEIFVLDLGNDLSKLKSGLRGKGIRSSVKLSKDCFFTYDKQLFKEEFPILYSEAMRRLGAKDFYFFNDRTIFELIESKNTLAIGVTHKGKLETGALFGFSPQIADYHLSASTDWGRSHSAAVIWKSIEMLKNMGIKYLNLGGGVTQQDGLAKFKSRFGGERKSIGGLKLVLDKINYDVLCTETISHQGLVHSRFPAYRA